MGKIIMYDLSKLKNKTNWQKPYEFDFNVTDEFNKVKRLIDAKEIVFIADEIDLAIKELYEISHPNQIDDLNEEEFRQFNKTIVGSDSSKYGKWIYYNWSKSLVHFPDKEDYLKLVASRNRNLINPQERKILQSDKTILIIGLSVGSNIADLLTLQGIGSKLVLVDMDILEPTNLNRIRATYDQLGVNKVDVVAKKISEVNPYLEQVHYKNGLNKQNFEEILSEHKPDIIIDEMDSLPLKLHIRMRAKELSIPVVMATDNGDDIILDIERYDIDKNTAILNGIMPDKVIEHILSTPKMSRAEAGMLIGKYFVDLKNVPLRMIESLNEVGKSLPSWPQLGGAAVLSGVYVTYAVRKIFLGQPLYSGRHFMGPENQLNPQLKSTEYQKNKKRLISLMTKVV